VNVGILAIAVRSQAAHQEERRTGISNTTSELSQSGSVVGHVGMGMGYVREERLHYRDADVSGLRLQKKKVQCGGQLAEICNRGGGVYEKNGQARI